MKRGWLSRLRALQAARALQKAADLGRRAQAAQRDRQAAGDACAGAEQARHAARARRDGACSVAGALGMMAMEQGAAVACAGARREAERMARAAAAAVEAEARGRAEAGQTLALRHSAARLERDWRRRAARRREGREEEDTRELRHAAGARREVEMRIRAADTRPALAERGEPVQERRRRFSLCMSCAHGALGGPASLGMPWRPHAGEAQAATGKTAPLASQAAAEIGNALLERIERLPPTESRLLLDGIDVRLCGGELSGLRCLIRVAGGRVDCRLLEGSAVRRVDLRALAPLVARRLLPVGLRLGRWEVQP